MGIFGLGPRTTRIERPRLAALQLAQTAYGLPVPIVYGTMRVPAALIDYDDFTAVPTVTKQRTGKTTVVTTDYSYTVMALYALCEGEIDGIRQMWADKDVLEFSDSEFTLFVGTLTQAAWSYLTTNHPAKALQYSGTAYVAGGPITLEGTGQLKNYSFEVEGLLRGLVTGATDDAFPPEMVLDFLTNTRYGAGWDPARIADFGIGQDGTAASSFERYCQASGFFLSASLIQQRPAREWLREWLVATNCGAIFSDGVLKVFPFGDQAVTGNSVTFTPYTTPRYDLGPDHLIAPAGSPDLFTVTRRPLADSFNTIPVEFLPRATVSATSDYNLSTVQQPEPVDADRYGVRQGPNLTLPAITTKEHALLISQIASMRSVYVRNVYRFRLPYRYILLDPMDLVTLTDPVRGITAQVVRLLTIEEDSEGLLLMEAEEWPFGVATGTEYATEENDGVNPNTLIPGGDTTAPQMFDVQLAVPADDSIAIGIVASGGAFWGGCEVWLSYDDITYFKVGEIAKKGTYGELTSGIGSGSGWQPTDDVDVDVTVSGGALVTVSEQEAQEGANLCWIDGEFLSFEDAALTDPFEYELTGFQRGLLGTTPAAHISGDKFARCDDAMFRAVIPIGRLSTTVYVKLPSFNIYGAALQAVDDATAYEHIPEADFAQPGGGPSLQVGVLNGVPTFEEVTITYVANGTVEIGSYVDPGGEIVWSTTPPSPIVGMRPPYGTASTMFIRCTRNGQTLEVMPAVESLPYEPPATPLIFGIIIGGVYAPGDGGGSLDVTWSSANMPGGEWFKVTVTPDSGDPLTGGSQSVDPATSPQTVTGGGLQLGTNAVVTVLVEAFTAGPTLIASAEIQQQIS